jgi:hypothetical protein
VERGVERALLHLQDLVRDLLYTLCNCPAMLRLKRDCFQDEQVKGALHEIARFAHTMTIYTSEL